MSGEPEFGWSKSVDTAVGADLPVKLAWEHVHEREVRGFDKKGKPQYRATANDLVLSNEGDTPAEDLTFNVEPVGDTQFAFPEPPSEPVTVHPHSSMSWLLIPTPSWGASGSTIRITTRWTESGEHREETRTVRLKGS